MISPKDITDLQLDAMFGHTMPMKIKKLVDIELNSGIWRDGYDIAVSAKPLDLEQATELLEIVLEDAPEFRIDQQSLGRSIDQHLPQSAFAQVSWIVADDASFVLTDSLRVVRYRRELMLWRTPRISFDGILLEAIEGREVRGKAFLLGSFPPDAPFVLSFDTGEVTQGQIVEP